MHIYLDVEGVLVMNGAPAPYAEDFIRFLTKEYKVFWLSTYCQGDPGVIHNLLGQFFSPETTEYVKKITPTNWQVYKTEAIDFSVPFLWFDDNPSSGERRELESRGALANWVPVNLKENPEQLLLFTTSLLVPGQLNGLGAPNTQIK